MSELFERLKSVRMELHLSQDYIAKYMDLNRTAIVEIESGKRKVSSEELRKFSDLYKISADDLLNGKTTTMPDMVFMRSFGSLDEDDQQEILNLIEFKKMLKEKRG
ncbi:MAG: helix-turn-helix transcriptional regulator [Lachnospiraceae bacterium]|nr:helix-turn-helix transcriptional regulator [Lachnospiraceae bacterium]